jgi:hypothetical protein
MWARAAVLAWPEQADNIHREFFNADPYTHFHIHPIIFNETHASVRWTYTFLDMGMEFVIDKCFYVSNEGMVVDSNASVPATDPAHLCRLVFDHYHSYVADLRHLDCVMDELEPMEI